jgi:uncharacterized protein (DUF58 family)
LQRLALPDSLFNILTFRDKIENMSFKENLKRLINLLRPPRRLRFTPEGTRFIIVALAIGVAAINTGNNLLYLILAMMLSMIILSGILSEISLRMVDVNRSLPREVFAGRPFLVRITASNRKRVFPSVSLTFQDYIEGTAAGSRYFLKIPANGKLTDSCQLTLGKRGVQTFRGGRLSTRYPFGLFLKSKEAGEESEVLVYPRIMDVKELLSESGVDEGEIESRIKGRGTDLYGLRGYLLGDDMRSIHWKTSAKLARLYVREFEREDARRATLILDDCIPEGFEAPLEKSISIAASLASHFLYKGYQVGLMTSTEEVPLGIGTDQLYRILRVLALITPGRERERLLAKATDAGGILILPYEGQGWKGREGSFSKVIRVGI